MSSPGKQTSDRQQAQRHGGRFPRSEEALGKLPGVGPYTAAAIAAIGFGARATPVDGNVERVVARLFAVPLPLPKAKPELRRLAERLTPVKRAGGRRYYRQQDLDLLHRIRSLLYEEGYTIKGVQRLLDEETASGRLVTPLPRPVGMAAAGDPAAEVPADAERRDDIVATLEDLREALAQLREALQVS